MSAPQNPIDRAIGKQIRARRDELQLSAPEIAAMLEVSADRYSKMESGTQRISLVQLQRLSDLLDVKPSYFFDTIHEPRGQLPSGEKKPNWLSGALGKSAEPKPPELRSERIKDLLGRALLMPGSLTPNEVQELAASVVRHLVDFK